MWYRLRCDIVAGKYFDTRLEVQAMRRFFCCIYDDAHPSEYIYKSTAALFTRGICRSATVEPPARFVDEKQQKIIGGKMKCCVVVALE